MRKLFFIAWLALIWPAATEAQFDDYQAREFFKAQDEFERLVKDYSIQAEADTLSVREVLKLRTLGKKEAYDFIITSNESLYGPGFRQGVYWPDGVIVDLPAKFNRDYLQVIARGKDIALQFVTNDSNGGYSLLTISLPPLPSIKVPCDVKIEALMR